MHLEIITPDRKVFAGEVTSVRFPGTDGSFEVLNNHAPLISALQAGDVVLNGGSAGTFHVSGGIVEVLRNNVIVLAESASA
ncbi:ATP synthase F1 subunit epsilon [Hymenobacter sp. HMF4947]|uniref:ATP synthase F1 subunit epsilon n=1 Tax=Hymenobacter ginkgonis TaxID=2682976 RepID=A0A7K1THM0_9BACT|nr:ATP synthase F1 subunit epsilon [Hymenobacter ginkgonis]MVN77908.1 ATP synthase F1 subunit epsilon [Hymenobacter ginkgonis]